eukprot:g5961.t1
MMGFDVVDHISMIEALDSYGAPDEFRLLICNFLRKRKLQYSDDLSTIYDKQLGNVQEVIVEEGKKVCQFYDVGKHKKIVFKFRRQVVAESPGRSLGFLYDGTYHFAAHASKILLDITIEMQRLTNVRDMRISKKVDVITSCLVPAFAANTVPIYPFFKSSTKRKITNAMSRALKKLLGLPTRCPPFALYWGTGIPEPSHMMFAEAVALFVRGVALGVWELKPLGGSGLNFQGARTGSLSIKGVPDLEDFRLGRIVLGKKLSLIKCEKEKREARARVSTFVECLANCQILTGHQRNLHNDAADYLANRATQWGPIGTGPERFAVKTLTPAILRRELYKDTKHLRSPHTNPPSQYMKRRFSLLGAFRPPRDTFPATGQEFIYLSLWLGYTRPGLMGMGEILYERDNKKPYYTCALCGKKVHNLDHFVFQCRGNPDARAPGGQWRDGFDLRTMRGLFGIEQMDNLRRSDVVRTLKEEPRRVLGFIRAAADADPACSILPDYTRQSLKTLPLATASLQKVQSSSEKLPSTITEAKLTGPMKMLLTA